jgi:hypothetical protein
MKRNSQTRKFCRCIKKVRKYIKPIRGTSEGAAIAVCVKSVLQTRGRTLRKFHCKGKKPYVATQPRKN